MYTLTVFETADEFFEACDPNGEIKPTVPETVYVVFDDSLDPSLSGDGAKKFALGDITQSEMMYVAFRRAGSGVHLT